jgi:hypothetical protein
MNVLDENLVRLAARIAAEETARVLVPGVNLGQEAAKGQGLPFDVQTVNLATYVAGDRIQGAPFRSLAVLSGGNAGVTLRLLGYDGQTKDLPAVPGLVLANCAAAGLSLVVPATTTGNLVLAFSPVPGCFGPPGSGCCTGIPVGTVATGNILVGLVETQIVPARKGRTKLLVIRVDVANDIFIGATGTVTTANGLLLDAVASPPIVDLGAYEGSLAGITTVAGQNLRFMETF